MAVANLPRDNALAGLCEAVLTNYSSYLGRNNTETLRAPYGALDFLHSQANLSGVALMQDDLGTNGGGYTEIRTRYMQRATDDTVVTTRSSYDCAGTEIDFFEQTIAVDGWVGSQEITITMDQMRQLCVPNTPMGEHFTRLILQQMNAMRRTMESNIYTDLTSGCFGVNINNLVSAAPSAAAKQITILNADGENLNNGINTLFIDFTDMEYSGPIHLVGQGNIERFWLNSGRGCCNDAGYDQGRAVDGLNLWKSVQTNTLLGDDQFVAFAPGVFQHFTVNPYAAWSGFGNSASAFYATIPDPVIPGIDYGMRVTFNGDCNDAWVLQFGVWTGTFCIPDDAFAAGDRLEDTNGITRWEALMAA